MKLQLRYTEKPPYPPAAAFLAGGRPEQWLAEISRWNLSFDRLRCFILPESMQSVAAAGLLVVFKHGKDLNGLDLRDPYSCLAERLYIPLNATVYPELADTEWKHLLAWDIQLLHPTMGLIGFRDKDELDPFGLLADSSPAGTNWSLANAGLPRLPALQYIEIRRQNPEEILQSMQDELDIQPLEDIKKDDPERSPLEKLTDGIKHGLYKGGLRLLDSLPHSNAPADKNWLNQLQDWLQRNLEELERRRQNELQRLLRLFDENSDEALRYAIPLDSTYAPRGTAPPGWTLGLRIPLFDLGRLGGGGRADAWDAGNHYHDLRAKYLKAAQEAIARGDFRKAAYVYAHLLNDFHSAANVLKQGKHYREAAVLFRDHLNNIPMAAECLEAGGLYLEAIECYLELNRLEKVGDLYRQIGQEDKATTYYEMCLAAEENSGNYLGAAHLAREKLQQPKRAATLLLQGWLGPVQSEPCLKKYFDLTLETEPEQARPRLEQVFAQHTSREKRPLLLNTLLYLNERYPEAELDNTTRHIAYEIIGDAAQRGDFITLQSLPKFLPDDPLIGGDTNRYIQVLQKAAKRQQSASRIPLDSSIVWLNAVTHRNQFLAVGLKNNHLHLARGNWYGHVEYDFWDTPVYEGVQPVFILNPYESPVVFIRLKTRQPLEQKVLPKNKYFDTELKVGCPDWLPAGDLGLAIEPDGQVAVLTNLNDKLELHFYTIDGALQRTVACFQPKQGMLAAPETGRFPGLIADKEYYYSYFDNVLLRVHRDGKTVAWNTQWRIRQLCATDAHQTFRLVALTDNGCLCFPPDFNSGLNGAYFFARDNTPIQGRFLTTDRFALSLTDRVSIFHLDPAEGILQKSIDTDAWARQVVALLPAAARHLCGVLDTEGEIRVFEV